MFGEQNSRALPDMFEWRLLENTARHRPLHELQNTNLKRIQSSTSWPDVAKSLIAVAAIALEFHPYSPTSHMVIAAPAAVLYYILCTSTM